MDPAQPAVADPVRAREVAAAHPGHDHRPHPPHRGRARLGQGGDQPDPLRARPPGPEAAAGDLRGRRRAPGRARGLSRGGEAVQREPRARGGDRAHPVGGGAAGLP